MSWRLSRFRTGEIVEVRSKEEILATLSADGKIDGMPFMPEMLQFCGQRFPVGSVAHKTCETAKRTYKGRRLDATVHLGDLRCDGSAHGGCQAACRLFWRDEWLRPVDGSVKAARAPLPQLNVQCDEARLVTNTQQPARPGVNGPRYSCQATELLDATKPLRWWDPRQYLLDVVTGNHSIGAVARALWLATMRTWVSKTPLGYRIVRRLREATHDWLVGGEIPDVHGAIPSGEPTPTGRLDLKPGDRVRIKPKSEIIETIRQDNNKNRGLSFDQEMVRYCGSVATVRSSVTNIIDEDTGEMVSMKQPCIILDGVVCMGEYSQCRLMCPRQLPQFWRELWLERVDEQNSESEELRHGARSLPHFPSYQRQLQPEVAAAGVAGSEGMVPQT